MHITAAMSLVVFDTSKKGDGKVIEPICNLDDYDDTVVDNLSFPNPHIVILSIVFLF